MSERNEPASESKFLALRDRSKNLAGLTQFLLTAQTAFSRDMAA